MKSSKGKRKKRGDGSNEGKQRVKKAEGEMGKEERRTEKERM